MLKFNLRATLFINICIMVFSYNIHLSYLIRCYLGFKFGLRNGRCSKNELVLFESIRIGTYLQDEIFWDYWGNGVKILPTLVRRYRKLNCICCSHENSHEIDYFSKKMQDHHLQHSSFLTIKELLLWTIWVDGFKGTFVLITK